MRTLYDSLLAADLDIDELLRYFDKDGDGKVSAAECIEALRTASLGLSMPQIQIIVRSLGFAKRRREGRESSAGRASVSGRESSSGRMSVGGGEEEIDMHEYLMQLTLNAKEKLIDVARNERERWDLTQVSRWMGVLAQRSGSPPPEVCNWREAA